MKKTTTVKKSSKITANNLTTKKQTAIIIAYAGEKYPDIWKKTFKQAQNNSVVVKLHNRKNFSYMKNSSDIAYEIATVVNISITQRMIHQFSDDYLNDTHTWVKGFNNTEALKGVNYITLIGWTAKDEHQASYGYTILDRHPVVILASGQGKLTDQVYWKTPDLAKKHQDQNFDKLITKAENN